MGPRTRRVQRKPARSLRRGERVTVTFEADVEANGILRPVGAGSAYYPRPSYGLAHGRILAANLGPAAVFEVALPVAPIWRPGDVVVVTYEGNPTPYTYVRGSRNWPGERISKTDAEIDDLFARGSAKIVLQAGGEPFDLERLP